MKLKGIGTLALAVVVLFFIGLNTCPASQELEDITTIVGDAAISDSSEYIDVAEDGEQLFSGTTTMLQDQNEALTQLAFELANNNQSDHFEFTHQFVPEPSTLLLLAVGGACLLRRGR